MMKYWKRNAAAAVIVVFVCGAVYLNWSYNNGRGAMDEKEDVSRTLGEAVLVDSVTIRPAEGGKENSEDAAPEPDAIQENETMGAFYKVRLNRQQARDSSLSMLLMASEDESTAQETIDEANRSIQAMASYTMAEAQIENLVLAKGYADCVVFLGENSASVMVAPTEGGLTAGDAARISDIVITETGLSADQIKIIESN